MRLDSLMNTMFMNTIGTMSNAWNVVTGQNTGWRRPPGKNTYNYNSYQSSARPMYTGTQPSTRGSAQYRGVSPGVQPSASRRPPTVNYISYVFNTNYVYVGGLKSGQVGVHVNNGNNSMNGGNFGNYGNNGNSGSHSRYSNHGSNGNPANLMMNGNSQARPIQA